MLFFLVREWAYDNVWLWGEGREEGEGGKEYLKDRRWNERGRIVCESEEEKEKSVCQLRVKVSE